ncbi:hypothetical protein WN944_022502 [Citrus x changshan-huyou]|uniref:NB-ARC domain-containing protein n=1 Tax=Citrus x changshan-huyou TaxID=2935761 RepID=A0AAP0N4F1_9ROSI
MGGVGKTTLLTHINNKFFVSSTDFDCVIWIVVSKDLQLEKIQEIIGKKVGLLDGDSWKNKNSEEKALEIFRFLSKKKFVLLLDDKCERVDLTKAGVPLPGLKTMHLKSYLKPGLFVCGLMEANKNFKVECLSDNDAWELLRQKVGLETLDSHHDILELAQTVAKKCVGLPLALITIGRAIACKRTPREWRYAIQVLRTSAYEFSGSGKDLSWGDMYESSFGVKAQEYHPHSIEQPQSLLYMCKSLKLVKELNQLIPILQSNAEMGISRGNPLSTQNVMTSRQKGVAGLDPSDWRNQLSHESRRRIVNKIMDTLKRHLPFSSPEGLNELKNMAGRFEEKIYTSATSQSDYLRKISLKMLSMESRSQNAMANPLQSNNASRSNEPPHPGSDVEFNAASLSICL